MTDTLQISLSNIQNIKNVNIEGVGIFRVRKLGAGEELDLSTKMRRLMEIATDLGKLNLTEVDENTPEGAKIFAKHSGTVSKYTKEIDDIKRFELETYKKCFTDDENGKKVDFLINALSDTERAELFKQIFGTPKEIDTPEAVKADEKGTDETN